jgi:hypothetical protein
MLEVNPMAIVAEATYPWIGRGVPARALPWIRARREVDALLYAEIAAHRAAPEGRDDVLAMLIAEGSLTDRELRDQLVTLLLAGHETTAGSLAWCFERLLHTPGEMQRLQRAVDEGDDAWLSAVVDETLRTRPCSRRRGAAYARRSRSAASGSSRTRWSPWRSAACTGAPTCTRIRRRSGRRASPHAGAGARPRAVRRRAAPLPRREHGGDGDEDRRARGARARRAQAGDAAGGAPEPDPPLHDDPGAGGAGDRGATKLIAMIVSGGFTPEATAACSAER